MHYFRRHWVRATQQEVAASDQADLGKRGQKESELWVFRPEIKKLTKEMTWGQITEKVIEVEEWCKTELDRIEGKKGPSQSGLKRGRSSVGDAHPALEGDEVASMETVLNATGQISGQVRCICTITPPFSFPTTDVRHHLRLPILQQWLRRAQTI